MRLQHVVVTVVTIAAAALVTIHADTPKSNDVLAGAWTLNKDASQLAPPRDDNGEGRDGDNVGRNGGVGGRRRGGGGFGGGGFGRGGGGVNGQQQRDAAQRMRDAMRHELQAPDHMTIVSSDTTIIITTPDGHTTRLAPDGKKIKDESTGIERKTKWDAGKLVSEVTGLGRGKITETYSVDAEAKQLHVTLDIDGPRKASQSRVYDLDPK